MTGEQLRFLRESRGQTREQLAEALGDCSASTINKWEREINPVPGWVAEKVLSTARVVLPLTQLHELLDLARESGMTFEDLLTEAAEYVVAKRRSKSQAPEAVNQGAMATTKNAAPAASSSNITPLPPQHFARAAEDTSEDTNPPAKKVSYTSGKKKRGA